MKSLRLLFVAALTLLGVSNAVLAETMVEIRTNRGAIVVALDDAKAPKTVANFLAYVKSGFYDGTIFHRVIPGFMIQGGGFTSSMTEKPTRSPIVNEAGNGLKNKKGTIAMARTSDPDSATSQFFINVADNDFLNAQRGNPGYAVFGRVVSGMVVVEMIARSPTKTVGPHADVPIDAVVIESIGLVDPSKTGASTSNKK